MILLLDNSDSFVHNLARYIRRVGCETVIVRSDQITADEALRLRPSGVVLSPGPHGPEQAGCCVKLIRQAPFDLPIFGVCLGHQCIGAAFGGQIIRSEPMHGMAGGILHNGEDIFESCPTPMNVGRYHSLSIDKNAFPGSLMVTARTPDRSLIMGVRHRTRPVFGVQFHPESVLTGFGATLIENFVEITRRQSARPESRVYLPYPYSEWSSRTRAEETVS